MALELTTQRSRVTLSSAWASQVPPHLYFLFPVWQALPPKGHVALLVLLIQISPYLEAFQSQKTALHPLSVLPLSTPLNPALFFLYSTYYHSISVTFCWFVYYLRLKALHVYCSLLFPKSCLVHRRHPNDYLVNKWRNIMAVNYHLLVSVVEIYIYLEIYFLSSSYLSVQTFFLLMKKPKQAPLINLPKIT